MVNKLFYILKIYLGFTRKESRGFVFLLPVLAFLYIIPSMIGWYYQSKADQEYEIYLKEASVYFSNLERNKLKPTLPIETKYTPVQDTVKIKSASLKKPSAPSLNQVPFHEADAVLLQMVYGMGPVLSERVQEYREKLGGFHKKEQLLEVYGINAELAESIFETFPFEPKIISKININGSDVKTLMQHPYIAYGEAKVIIAYQNQHGPFSRPEDLLRIKIFNQEWVDRISPYLEF